MTKGELKAMAALAADLAVKAGAILRRGFNHVRWIDYKGRINPVTDYDLKAERFITRKISAAYPDHEILAEEAGAGGRGSEFRWIIDPLDGTVNYAHGFPVYCVSIALEYFGEVVAGAVYDPERDELFRSARGTRALLNGRPITVSPETRLERALLATGFAYDIGTARRNNLGLFARMARRAQAIRRPGSAALDLCWLACGRIDGFWELKLHPWDTAAAALIVANAGGKVTRINGKPFSIFDADVLASNGRIHGTMQRVLTRR